MNRICSLLLAAAALLLGGCAQMARPLNEHVMFTEDSWAKAQKNNNVQAIVEHDEAYSFLRMGGIEVVAGVGNAERRYRRVSLYMTHSEGGRPTLGFKGYMRFVAIVPDGMPLLKLGDVVEVRFGNVYDHLKGFATTGEGSAVLRLLCPVNENRGQLDALKACASHLAWYEPWGEDKRFYDGIVASPSGRPYLPSLKAHTELSFTPYYDDSGKVLPNAVVPAARPSLDNWPAPKRF